MVAEYFLACIYFDEQIIGGRDDIRVSFFISGMRVVAFVEINDDFFFHEVVYSDVEAAATFEGFYSISRSPFGLATGVK